METAYEEKKRLVDGIKCLYECHNQCQMGMGPMSGAHYHDYIEILYGDCGTVQIILDGESYRFSKGDMVLINSREIHSTTALSSGKNSYLVIKFEPDVLYTTTQTIFEAKYLLPFTNSHSTHQKVFTRDVIQETFIPHALREISQEYSDKNYGYELAIRAAICKIFLWILRSWNRKGVMPTQDRSLDEGAMNRLRTVFTYVETHYQEDITAKDMASLCAVSYSYFSRFFKRAMQKTFREYLNFVRISEAEKLLLNTDLNITEIAMEVGFSSSSYFIEQFKQLKSISPKRFRQRLLVTGSGVL